MGNLKHLRVLRNGVAAWNEWRLAHAEVKPDLSWFKLNDKDLSHIDFHEIYLTGTQLVGADLTGANLSRAELANADLRKARLIGANLYRSHLWKTDLYGSDLTHADLRHADASSCHMREANLQEARLESATMYSTNFYRANLTNADLRRANLREANLVRAVFRGANLNGARIYGVSAWGVDVTDAEQSGLIITPKEESPISVDNLEIAQFIHLLLTAPKLRAVIETITSKLVLILGRFSSIRKPVLNVISDVLRKCGYVPVIFDFQKPKSRDVAETVSTLAHLARFVIADISEARSVSQELELIVPRLPSLPIQPLIAVEEPTYGLFAHIERYEWVLPIYKYECSEDLGMVLRERLIPPLEKMIRDRIDNENQSYLGSKPPDCEGI